MQISESILKVYKTKTNTFFFPFEDQKEILIVIYEAKKINILSFPGN